METETEVNLICVASIGFLLSWNQANMCQVHRKQSSISMLAMNWSWLPPPCLHDNTMKVGKRKYNCMWLDVDSQGTWLSVYRGENEEKKKKSKVSYMSLHGPGKHEVKKCKRACNTNLIKEKNFQNVLMKKIFWSKLQRKTLTLCVCCIPEQLKNVC